MNDRLYLHVPEYNELWYRQRLMHDPDTMSYNRGYDLAFDGYHRDTGCIDFPEERWREWYDRYIGQEPKRFYAYVVRREDGEFIGEVNVHRSEDNPWYEMGIVIEARHRGKGYSAEALDLLLEHAFERLGADSVHNDFEESRSAALHIHLRAGFTEHSRENGILGLILTKERYGILRNKLINRRRLIKLEEDLGCTFCADGIFAEMSLDLEDYREKTAPIDNVSFGFYRGSTEEIRKIVFSVDEDWCRFFCEDTPVFCGFIDGQPVSFCSVYTDADCIISQPGIRVGSIGCVGTVPEFRERGIGLRMVDLAALVLKNEGCDKAYIHYTHIDKWYEKLGFETFARFSFKQQR